MADKRNRMKDDVTEVCYSDEVLVEGDRWIRMFDIEI